MRWYIVCVLTISLGSLSAQSDYVIHDTLPTYVGKNEIRTNLTPVAVTFMAGEPIIPRWSLMYRRYLSPNKALRVWLNYEQFSFVEEDLTEADIIPTGPSKFNFVAEDQHEYGIDLRLGIDWSKPDRKISAVYGLDVFAGWESRQYTEGIYPYYLDENLCSTCWVPSPFESPTYERAELTYFKAGMDFSVGCLFRPKDNWEITLQWTPEIAYRSVLDSEFNSDQAMNQIRNDGLSFHFRGLELFMGFHF
jgi:hypothetical protein